jgi:hypothetical protein
MVKNGGTMNITLTNIFNWLTISSHLNGICVARSCSEKPLRSISTQSKKEQIGKANEKIDPVNSRSCRQFSKNVDL